MATANSFNLYEASAQWASRPNDERFESLQSMYDACKAYAVNSISSHARRDTLKLETQGTDLALIGSSGQAAKISHYAFGQLSRLAGAPAAFVRGLPSRLASDVINHGLSQGGRGADKLNLLFNGGSSLTARAITSDSYDRVWNYEIVQRIMRDVASQGWVVPPARPARPGQKGTRKATAADILPGQGDFGLAVKEGDEIAPAGLYASDHDMFAFLVNQAQPVSDGVKLLNRGVFIQNSEVGDCALKFKFFTYDNVCGNHIVWGAGAVNEVSIRHIKSDSVARGRTMANAMSKWNVMARSLPSQSQMENAIIAAKGKEIAGSKDDVLDAVFKFAKSHSLPALSKSVIEGAYAVAERTPRYGSPRSVWGMVNGLTEFSQTSTFTDERTEIDVQAGRVMEMAF